MRCRLSRCAISLGRLNSLEKGRVYRALPSPFNGLLPEDPLDPVEEPEVRVEGGGVVHVADDDLSVHGDVLPVVGAEGQGHEGHRGQGADRGQAEDDRAAVVIGRGHFEKNRPEQLVGNSQ